MKYLQVTDGVSVGGVFNDNPGITIESDWVRIDNVTPEPQLGWSYDGTTWTNPDDGLVSVDLLRVRRDDRLSSLRPHRSTSQRPNGSRQYTLRTN